MDLTVNGVRQGHGNEATQETRDIPTEHFGDNPLLARVAVQRCHRLGNGTPRQRIRRSRRQPERLGTRAQGKQARARGEQVRHPTGWWQKQTGWFVRTHRRQEGAAGGVGLPRPTRRWFGAQAG
jgi:hypothetical protein